MEGRSRSKWKVGVGVRGRWEKGKEGLRKCRSRSKWKVGVRKRGIKKR